MVIGYGPFLQRFDGIIESLRHKKPRDENVDLNPNSGAKHEIGQKREGRHLYWYSSQCWTQGAIQLPARRGSAGSNGYDVLEAFEAFDQGPTQTAGAQTLIGFVHTRSYLEG